MSQEEERGAWKGERSFGEESRGSAPFMGMGGTKRKLKIRISRADPTKFYWLQGKRYSTPTLDPGTADNKVSANTILSGAPSSHH